MSTPSAADATIELLQSLQTALKAHVAALHEELQTIQAVPADLGRAWPLNAESEETRACSTGLATRSRPMQKKEEGKKEDKEGAS